MFLSQYFSSPVSAIPPMLYTNFIELHIALIRKTSGRSLGNFEQSNALSDIWEVSPISESELERKVLSHLVYA